MPLRRCERSGGLGQEFVRRATVRLRLQLVSVRSHQGAALPSAREAMERGGSDCDGKIAASEPDSCTGRQLASQGILDRVPQLPEVDWFSHHGEIAEKSD